MLCAIDRFKKLKVKTRKWIFTIFTVTIENYHRKKEGANI